MPAEAPEVVVVKEVSAVDDISCIMPPEMNEVIEESVVPSEETLIQEEMIVEATVQEEKVTATDSEPSTPLTESTIPVTESVTAVKESTTPVTESSPKIPEASAPVIETAVVTESTTVPTTTSTTATSVGTPSSTSKCLAGTTLSVSTELAMEQIAKKLNERAARGKESIDDKEKAVPKGLHSRENSPDLDRSIEEGEIVSSAAATPDPQQPASKSSKTTVIIKPKVGYSTNMNKICNQILLLQGN